MKYRDRDGNEFIEANSQEKFLEMLYDTSFGRRLLSILVKPGLSSFAGDMLDTKASKCLIPSFIRQNNINMDEYIDTDFESYNDFFTRKIKQSARPFDMAPDVLCSPCDAKLRIPFSQSRIQSTLLRSFLTAKRWQRDSWVALFLCSDSPSMIITDTVFQTAARNPDTAGFPGFSTL